VVVIWHKVSGVGVGVGVGLWSSQTRQFFLRYCPGKLWPSCARLAVALCSIERLREALWERVVSLALNLASTSMTADTRAAPVYGTPTSFIPVFKHSPRNFRLRSITDDSRDAIINSRRDCLPRFSHVEIQLLILNFIPIPHRASVRLMHSMTS
jgi:hypothetical protein